MIAARLWDVVPAAVAWAVTRGLYGYPWQLALLTTIAVYALGYSARRTVFNLRQLHATRQQPLFVRDTPGEEDEGGEEHDVDGTAERVPGEEQHEPGGDGGTGGDEASAGGHR